MHYAAVLLVTMAVVVPAQEPPYVNPLPADPPYYRVRYEGSTTPGNLVFPVSYTIWIPPRVETLRGVIVHQHGCGEGSGKSGQTGAFDLHWQALARKHGCALASPVYEQPEKANCALWCDPRNGSLKGTESRWRLSPSRERILSAGRSSRIFPTAIHPLSR